MKLIKLATVGLLALTLCSWISGMTARPSSEIASQQRHSAVQKETTTENDVSCGSARISRPCQ